MRWLGLILTRFGTRTLAILAGVLFVVDLFLPDPIPLVDELFLAAATLLLARWRRPPSA